MEQPVDIGPHFGRRKMLFKNLGQCGALDVISECGGGEMVVLAHLRPELGVESLAVDQNPVEVKKSGLAPRYTFVHNILSCFSREVKKLTPLTQMEREPSYAKTPPCFADSELA